MLLSALFYAIILDLVSFMLKKEVIAILFQL